MDRESLRQQLETMWAEVHDLSRVVYLLEWDQETCLPSAGRPERAAQLGTVVALRHRAITQPKLGEVIAEILATEPADSELAVQAARAKWEVDRAVRVPESLARAIAEAQSRGATIWKDARRDANFAHFAPALSTLVELRREEADAIRPDGPRYDALLDGYEPGMTESELVPLFAHLRDALVPLVETVREASPIDQSPLRGDYPMAGQRSFSMAMAEACGFDFNAGRLDAATHPFCVGIGTGDTRLTWRWEDDDFRPGLFGVLHETGHGIYDQNLPAAHARTPIGDAVSLGIHESQSRLWENHVGRNESFWRWALPRLRETFPAADFTLDQLWPILHVVEPSLIRVEADETTYNLHIVIRFELERQLIGGTLEVADLPTAWNEAYHELLGIRPANDAEGVLQDIHWSAGMFGYFPTYTLGTMAAAQLYAAADRDLGDLDVKMAQGDLAPLFDWLNDKIYRHGSRYAAGQLIERATGKALAADDLLDHLRRSAARAYDLTL
ncbi:MAG: carboxypeptidase M32 [Acidobacteriota bacterium]